VVTRASVTITADELEPRITRALASRQRSTDTDNLTLSFDGEVRPIHLEPATDLRLARLTFDPRSGRFDALFERPDRARNYIRFTGTYAETFETAVLARPLAAGDIVKASDLAVMRRPKAQFNANVVTRTEDAIGLAARRALRPGDLLRQADLAKPEVVARNDNVTITYQVPGIALTMRGKALEAGTHGEVIHVLNEQSKRTIQATVAGRGHVVVTAAARVINVTPATTAPRLAADATGRPSSNPRARAE
jgi:flagella basal body P-ring formation protein FlgA